MSTPLRTRQTLMTAEEYAQLPDDGKRYELVRGVLVEMSHPQSHHGVVTGNVYYQLRRWLDVAKRGALLLDVGHVIERGPDTVRGPDVAFVRNGRLDLRKTSWVEGGPVEPRSQRRALHHRARVRPHGGTIGFLGRDRMLLAVFRRWTSVCLLASLCLLSAYPALGQTVTGTIQGTVADASGGVLPGVTVTLRNLDTGATRVVVTNDVGFYQAPFLPLGPFSVTAELDGFKTFVQQPAEINGPWLTRGNDTPANRAFIQSVLARFPNVTPNDPRSPRTYATVVQRDWPDQDYTGRVDWNLGRGDTMFARYQWTNQKRQTEEVIVGEQTRQDNTQQNLGITWTHVFGPATLGEFRYGLGLRDTNVTIADGDDTPIIRWNFNPVSGPIVGNAGTFPILRDQTDHQFVYNFSTVLGANHSVKVGTDIRLSALDDRADNFNRGFWTFSTSCGGQTYATSWAAFFDGCVTTFTKAYGPNFLENRLKDYNFYAEDNWRLAKNLTLNLGLRYEYVTAPEEVKDRIDYVFGDDTNNVQPRVGFAWAPAFERGILRRLTGAPGGFSLRGGYGTYHGRIFQSVFSQSGASVRGNPPNAVSLSFTNQLNVADPSNGFVFTPGTPTTRISITIPDEDLEMPMTHQWNLTVERKMFWDSSLRLSYTGTYSDNLVKYSLGNLPQSPLDGPVTVVDHPFNAPAAGFPDLRGKQITAIAADVACAGTGFLPGLTTNATCPVPVPIADHEISLRVPRTNERRPDPRYGTNTLISNDGISWYHGLQTEWTKRLSNGLAFTASYTWSKALDTVSEATFVGTGDSNNNGPNKNYAKGYSRFHTPHRFTLSGSYKLPWLLDRADLLGQVFGGWQVSGIVRLAAGTPFTVISTGVDLNFDGFSESRPVLLDPSILFNSVDDPAKSLEQLPRSAFRTLTINDINADLVGRNTFFVDGTNRVDLGIYKTFNLPYRHSLNVRIEAFNAFNQMQFGFPSNNVTATNFGVINTGATAYAPRVVQLALRYRF